VILIILNFSTVSSMCSIAIGGFELLFICFLSQQKNQCNCVCVCCERLSEMVNSPKNALGSIKRIRWCQNKHCETCHTFTPIGSELFVLSASAQQVELRNVACMLPFSRCTRLDRSFACHAMLHGSQSCGLITTHKEHSFRVHTVFLLGVQPL